MAVAHWMAARFDWSPSDFRSHHFHAFLSHVLLFVACLAIPRSAWAAPKVDVVQLKNGDRLTCEIKKLQQGQLSISTDALESVKVHWGEVVVVTSPREFEITLQSGDRYYGTLSGMTPGQL